MDVRFLMFLVIISSPLWILFALDRLATSLFPALVLSGGKAGPAAVMWGAFLTMVGFVLWLAYMLFWEKL